MGFSSVYRVLQEVFPQVDSRILRAVAIEHSKDADVAVEVVLVEVIPHLSEQSLSVSSSNKSKSSLSLSEDGGKTGLLDTALDSVDVTLRLPEKSLEAGTSSVDGSLPDATKAVDAGFSGEPNSPTFVVPVFLGSLELSSYHDANGETDTVGDNDIINLDNASLTSIIESGSFNNHDQESVKSGGEIVASFTESDVTAPAVEYSCIHMNVVTKTLIAPSNETRLVVTQEPDLTSSSQTSEKNVLTSESVNSENESHMTSMFTSLEQSCSTELLEEIIEDARNNKKSFVLDMNSVVDLMREVELKEKAAEQAKEEATRDCSDIYAKVDELKQALERAKEANAMHAGEVYAEKSILATEMKELQLRLFTLSDERNKSLRVLDEMRKALEIRLASALEEIAAAEEEKIEKEKSAKEALLSQENQMEKVVQESKKLKLEAEENSKLQDFLMDRGRAIDILQGEILVRCQDVLLLKEKFEKRIPLSRSLSCSQTSSVLTSSTSSFRSESEIYGTPKKGPEWGGDFNGILVKSSKSEVGQSPKYLIKEVNPTTSSSHDYFSYGEEKQIDDRRALVNDGWEIICD